MRRLWTSLVWLIISTGLVHADAVSNLYNQAIKQLQAKQYAEAAQGFDEIIAKYPTAPYIDDARIRAGFAYLHIGDNAKAIDHLSKLITQPIATPEKAGYRVTALFFTGAAQFAMAQELTKTDKPGMVTGMTKTASTLTALLDAIAQSPTADNKVYQEDAHWYRALAEFMAEDYPASEKDLQTLLQPPFDTSLKKPDYLSLLGGLYFNQTAKAVDAKKSPDEIKALGLKSLAVFEKVALDPNASPLLVEEAKQNQAQIHALLAQFSNKPAGQKATNADHKVHPPDESAHQTENGEDESLLLTAGLLFGLALALLGWFFRR